MSISVASGVCECVVYQYNITNSSMCVLEIGLFILMNKWSVVQIIACRKQIM